jgi:hypothetical protein
MRDALPGPLLATSSKVARTAGLKKASRVFHSLFTGCGEDRSRVKLGLVPTTGRPDGNSERGLSASPVTGECRRFLNQLQNRPVSSMEGTSGAADPAPLRGGASDAALGSGCVVPACPCASVVRSRVARHGARPSRDVAFRARRSLPFAGVGLAWWDREGVALPRAGCVGSHP